MAKDLTATIHLKTTPALRNRVSGKLRMRGVTMQSFFVDLMELIDKDEALLELLEHKRDALNAQRNQWQDLNHDRRPRCPSPLIRTNLSLAFSRANMPLAQAEAVLRKPSRKPLREALGNSPPKAIWLRVAAIRPLRTSQMDDRRQHDPDPAHPGEAAAVQSLAPRSRWTIASSADGLHTSATTPCTPRQGLEPGLLRRCHLAILTL